MPDDHYYTANPQSRYSSRIITTISHNRTFEFHTAPGVFGATKVDTGTLVFLKKIDIPNEGRILDLGCGIGIVGIVAGVLHPLLEIHFIDINARATELAEKNAEKYQLKRYTIYTGDCEYLLDKNSIIYDAIYYNPPIRLGKKLYYKHIQHALNFLKPIGYIQVVIKKKLGAESAYRYFLENLDRDSYRVNILGKNAGYWVFEIRKVESV